MRRIVHSGTRYALASRARARARAMRQSLVPWDSELLPKHGPTPLKRARDLIRQMFPSKTTELIVKTEWTDLENSSARLPCCVVADTSGSMSGTPINELNAGLKQLGDFVREDALAARSAEICVVSAGEPLVVAVPFTPAAHFHPPMLQADGGTPLAEAIVLAITATEERIRRYNHFDFDWYRPWVLVISDGMANQSSAIPVAIREVRRVENARLMSIFAVGTNRDAVLRLNKFSVRPAEELDGFDFSKLFRWLSEHIIRVSHSMQGDEPDDPDMSRADWRKL